MAREILPASLPEAVVPPAHALPESLPDQYLKDKAAGVIKESTEALTPQEFENRIAYTEWVIKNTLPLYPPQHEVSRYLNQLFRKLVQPAEANFNFSVSVYHGEPNAFALANGSIFVSDGLFLFADTEEELLFVLAHEKKHVTEEHAKAILLSPTDSSESIIKNALRLLGRERFAEWEGDLRAFDYLDKLKINPLGGINLLEKFRASTGPGRISVFHGKETDRVLNLRGMTYLTDLEAVEKPFHPIPRLVKSVIRKEEPIVSDYDLLLVGLEERDIRLLNQIIPQITAETAMLVLPYFLGEQERAQRLQSDRAQLWSRLLKEKIPMLGVQVWDHLEDTLGKFDLSQQQTSFVFFAILEHVSGVDATDPERQKYLFEPKWSKRQFQNQVWAEEDAEELLETLTPEIFAHLGLKIRFPPDSLIENFLSRVFERKIFHDENDEFLVENFLNFANRFTDTLAKLYLEQGTSELKSERLYQKLLEAARKFVKVDRWDELTSLAIKIRPEARFILQEKLELSGQQLIDLFLNFVKELEPFEDESYKDLDLQAEKTGKQLAPQLSEALNEVITNNPKDIVTFLALVRKTIQDDPKLSELFRKFGERWSSLVYGEILNNTRIKNYNLAEIDKLLFDLKVAILLAVDEGADIFIYLHSALEKIMEKPIFTLEAYQQFYNLAKAANTLAQETGLPVTTAVLLEHEGWQNTFKDGIYLLLGRALDLQPTREEFSRFLETVTVEFSLRHYGMDYFYAWGEAKEKPKELYKSRLLGRIFANFAFDLANSNHLKDLYFLSTYLEDTSLAIRLQNVVLEKLIVTMPFESGLAFLEQEIKSKRLLSLGAVQAFVEKKAQTWEEIEKARGILIKLLTSTSASLDFGKLILGEQFIDILFARSKFDFLLASIGNSKDDSLLKQYFYRRWRTVYEFSPQGAESDLNLEDILQRLYRLDAQTKYVLIRDLLTGNRGALVGKDIKRREELIDFFLNNFVEAANKTEAKLLEVIREVMKETARTASYDLLYFVLSPLLQERVLVPPSQKTTWESIIAIEMPPSEFSPRTYSAGKFTWQKLPRSKIRQINRLIVGTKQEKIIQKSAKFRSLYEPQIEAILKEMEESSPRLKLSVAELVIETAQKLGAPGVRFLQLIGQYFAVTPELEKAFLDVYEQVQGQSKITAQQTLLREWPEAKEALAGLQERVGGGSLLSVFKTSDRQERERVVKILNPNAGFHTEATRQLLTEVFTNLSQRKPQFSQSLTLLDDINEWIRGDIDFTGFLEQDKRFRKTHDGFTLSGNLYQMKIPQSFGPENKFFQQEEFIAGINLTATEELKSQGHDLQAIVTLIARDFLEQVKDGLVHPDLHPGNIRVTPNNEVALLDRNFYLQPSTGDKIFLGRLFKFLENPVGAARLSFEYLLSIGKKLDDVKKKKIEEAAGSLGEVSDPTDRLLQLAILFRKEDIKFPLKITLMIKNLFYLDRLAKRVGYRGILETYKS